ncbi:MAG: histidine kinase [Clostridia bacterium]
MRKKKHFGAISLNSVLILVVSLTAFVAMIISTFLLFARFNKIVIESAQTTTEQAVKNVSKSVDTFVDNMLESLYNIEKIVNEKTDKTDITDSLNTLLNLRSDLVDIILYDKEGNIIECISNEKYPIKPNATEKNLSFDASVFSNPTEYQISQPHVNNIFSKYYPWVVTVSSVVNSAPYGVVCVSMDVSFSGIAKYIDDTSIGERGYTYVVNSDKKIIYHPQQQLIFLNLKQENSDTVDSLVDGQSMLSENNIYASSSVNKANWNIIGVSYIKDLVTVKRVELLTYCAILLVFGVAVSILLGLLVSRGLGRPMNLLIASMAEFENSVETYKKKEIKGFYEVNSLSKSFEHMAMRIQNLMEKVKNEEKELRKVELKALQAQINPHFLYNTLDSILWMCQQNGNEDAAEMVSALSKLFRISISRGKDLISIETELKHVESYLVIQSIRYKNQFKYVIDVDKDILNYK